MLYLLFPLALSIYSTVYAAPKISWIEPPPATVEKNDTFTVKWDVENLPGSFHAICTLCPEAQGPHCKKGSQRYDSSPFSGQDHGQFSADMSFPQDAPAGEYYISAYGAYSKSEYYSTESLKISYARQSQNTNSKTQSATSASSSTESSESNTNTTVVVAPTTPHYWPGYYPGYEEENNVTVNNNASENNEYSQNNASREDNHNSAQERQQGGRENNNRGQQRERSSGRSGERGGSHQGSHRGHRG
jgi:hypothetical protein